MHSPTPWYSDNNEGYSITRIYPARKTQYVSIVAEVIGDSAEAESNAALIVKAVNSYEAMREALKGAQNDINFHGGKLSGGTIDAIKKALTLAEGKEPS